MGMDREYVRRAGTYRGQTSGLSAVSNGIKWEEVTDPHCCIGVSDMRGTEKSEMGKGRS